MGYGNDIHGMIELSVFSVVFHFSKLFSIHNFNPGKRD